MTTDQRLQKIRSVLWDYGQGLVRPLWAGTPASRDRVCTLAIRNLADAIDQLERVESLLYRANGGMIRHGAKCSECQIVADEIESVMDTPKS